MPCASDSGEQRQRRRLTCALSPLHADGRSAAFMTGLQAVRRLTRLWVVGCAENMALPGLQLLSDLRGALSKPLFGPLPVLCGGDRLLERQSSASSQAVEVGWCSLDSRQRPSGRYLRVVSFL